MDTNNISIEQPIKFRNKFLSKIPNDQFKKNMDILVRNFNHLSPEEALRRLWGLTYTTATAALDLTQLVFGYSSEEVENTFVTPADLIPPVRNELRYQYQQASCPNFLEVDIPENCAKQFKLFASSVNDKIVEAIAAEHCTRYIKNHSDADVERAIFLLRSPHEKNYFGGLREINFNYDEAVFLKPYAAQIGDLMEALAKEKKRVDEENLPFFFSTPALEEAEDVTKDGDTCGAETQTASCGANVPATEAEGATFESDTLATDEVIPLQESVEEETLPVVNVSIPTVSKTPQLTPQVVLAHQELIEEFLEYYETYQHYIAELSALGIDSNEVVAKSEAIGKLLIAALTF